MRQNLLNVNIELSSIARDIFLVSLYLHPHFVYASSESSGETIYVCRYYVRTFVCVCVRACVCVLYLDNCMSLGQI